MENNPDLDVIELSSDTESVVSCKANEKLEDNFSSEADPSQWSSDYNYDICPWDDYDDHPPIDYNIKISPEKEDENHLKVEHDEANSSDDTLPYDAQSFDTLKDNNSNSKEDLNHIESFTEEEINEKKKLLSEPKSKKKRLSASEKSLEKEKAKALANEKKLEREKLKQQKKAELLQQKAVKAALAERHKNLKPEESIKFLKVHIDNEIINAVFGGNIITVLQQAEVQYAVESQLKPYILQWSKRVKETVVTDTGEFKDRIDIVEQDQLVYILTWQRAVELVYRNELLSHVETIKSLYLNKSVTIVIYGIEKYFNYQKIKKNREMKSSLGDGKAPKPKRSEMEFEEAPFVTRDMLEIALTELQLLGKSNHRLLETPEELSALVLQFTKSLAQLDYKQEKNKVQSEQLDWFAGADSKQCVRVDKNGNGLLTLWKQQITQFNNVGIEVAQAIVSIYNSPQSLLAAYNECSSVTECELLLQNIPVRRNAGIFSSSRRIGPELSKKIYYFLTSDNPNLEL